MKKKVKTSVKVREITAIYFDGHYDTKDRRYNVKYSIKKVIMHCLRNEFSFKVGFHGNELIPNKRYIEITCETINGNFKKHQINFDKLLKLQLWLEKGEE